MLQFLIQNKSTILFALVAFAVINFLLKSGNFVLKMIIFVALAILIAAFIGVDLGQTISNFASTL